MFLIWALVVLGHKNQEVVSSHSENSDSATGEITSNSLWSTVCALLSA